MENSDGSKHVLETKQNKKKQQNTIHIGHSYSNTAEFVSVLLVASFYLITRL
jgi:hypothetical protein